MRSFATAAPAMAKSAPLIQPPMKLSGPVGIYTQALWSAANEKGEKDKVTRDAKVRNATRNATRNTTQQATQHSHDNWSHSIHFG